MPAKEEAALSIARTAALIAASIIWPSAAHAAEAYPAKPVRMLVGFPPGGANDLVARAVATRLGPRLYKPGSGLFSAQVPRPRS